jgi:hypothetical protein
MYNPGIQVQIPTDANLGSYYLLTKTRCGGLPHRFPFKKKITVLTGLKNAKKLFEQPNRSLNYRERSLVTKIEHTAKFQ